MMLHSVKYSITYNTKNLSCTLFSNVVLIAYYTNNDYKWWNEMWKSSHSLLEDNDPVLAYDWGKPKLIFSQNSQLLGQIQPKCHTLLLTYKFAVLTLLCLTPLHSYQSLFKHNLLLSKYCVYLNMRQPCIYDSHSSQSSIFRKISIHSTFKFVCDYNANPHFSEYKLG